MECDTHTYNLSINFPINPFFNNNDNKAKVTN